MIGAIAGDMIGSPYEGNPIKHKNFPIRVSRFTDDTVLTIAVAHAILGDSNFLLSIKHFAREYHDLPYGASFRDWMWSSDDTPYNSFGNGSAMRVSPVGYAYDSVADVLFYAKQSAEVSHNHPEGIKGAQAAALAVCMARQGESKGAIHRAISHRFDYDLDRTLDVIRPGYRFDVSCQGSVPESIIAFLASESYEDTIRNAISLGGDSDTMACIAGGIAQAYYKRVPKDVVTGVRDRLPEAFLDILDAFNKKYQCRF